MHSSVTFYHQLSLLSFLFRQSSHILDRQSSISITVLSSWADCRGSQLQCRHSLASFCHFWALIPRNFMSLHYMSILSSRIPTVRRNPQNWSSSCCHFCSLCMYHINPPPEQLQQGLSAHSSEHTHFHTIDIIDSI